MKIKLLWLMVIGLIIFEALLSNGVLADSAWVSPDYDVDNGWVDSVKAYDDDTFSRAQFYVPVEAWSSYLELWLDDDLVCSKVRVWSSRSNSQISVISVDVRYGGNWVNIYEGTLNVGNFVEYNIGSEVIVEAMQVKYYNMWAAAGVSVYVHEIDFWGYCYVPPEPATLVLVPESDTNDVGTNHNLLATVYDGESEVMEGVAVEWSIISGVGSFVSYDEVTDENGEADAVITSAEAGNTTVKCKVTGYEVSDTAVKYWEGVPSSLVLVPEFDTNYVGSNHSMNATVYDGESEVMGEIEVAWSILSGPGWFESAETETGVDGKAEAVISSNVTGNTTVKCVVVGYPDIFDTAIKEWEVVPELLSFALPVWYVVLLLVVVGFAAYTGAPLLLIAGLTGAVVGVFWLLSFALDAVVVWLAVCLFFCIGCFCLLSLIGGDNFAS